MAQWLHRHVAYMRSTGAFTAHNEAKCLWIGRQFTPQLTKNFNTFQAGEVLFTVLRALLLVLNLWLQDAVSKSLMLVEMQL